MWHSGEIDTDNSVEQSNLQLAGIVVKKESKLKVYNLIYQNIFDNIWIEKALVSLRPYYKLPIPGVRANCAKLCRAESKNLSAAS